MKVCLACSAEFDVTGWQCGNCGFEPGQLHGYPAFAPELATSAITFDPAYFSELARLEARSFWFRARNRLIEWSLARYFPRAASFLEIGCGTGYVLSMIARRHPDWRLAGSEMLVAGLAFAASRVPTADFLQMDARRIPYRDEFDVLGAFDVLEHVPEDDAVLAAMWRAVKPGGGMVLTVPQHRFLWSLQDEHAHHVRRYEAHELLSKVASSGFVAARCTSFMTMLLPAMLLSRRAKTRASSKPFDELKLGRMANHIAEAVMDIDLALIRLGVDLPVGGSLLLVARKAGGSSRDDQPIPPAQRRKDVLTNR